jgi:2-polyprenyl-3-methyl-5-hydroxy-6-metoxy-1,4-benzoquinol methylase
VGDFEQTSCPLCGDTRSELYCEAPDRFNPNSGQLFAIQRCLNCRMVYLNPRPRERDSGQFYEHADYLPFASLAQKRSLTTRLYEWLRRANLIWKRRTITNFLQQAKREAYDRARAANHKLPHIPYSLLDVGCGTGEFLAIMEAAGWQVEGLERDERAAGWARDNWHVPVMSGGVEQLAALERRFDVITLWHVLEHLYAPGPALKILADHLYEDGWLLIAVPNIDGIDARVYKSNWVALDAPRHVNHFSPETLARLGRRHGLALRWWRQLPMDAFFNALMSEQLAAARHPGRWLWWPVRLVRAFAVACAALIGGSHTPFSYASYGASLVCFFEKK